MAKIRANQRVIVEDWGGIYSTDTCYMSDLLKAGNITINVLARWAFGDSTHYDEQLKGKVQSQTYYSVLYVDEKAGRCLITANRIYGKVYCIKLNNVEPLKPLYTKEDLVNKLGYDFDFLDYESGNIL